MGETDILQKILNEAGLVAFILAIFCGMIYRLYMNEHKERQAIQHALTDLVRENNEVIQKITLVLTSINERLR